MKVLEFETSKGRFIVIDNNQDDNKVIQFLKDIPYSSYMNRIKLSEITEEQASEIVDKVMNNQHFQNYDFKEITDRWTKSAIESLHSLLKYKGVHLFENPYKDTLSIQSLEGSQKHRKQIEEAEQKTFYNPFIFKL